MQGGGLCCKAGIHGLSPSSSTISFGVENRVHAVQVSALGRSGDGGLAKANGVSVENPVETQKKSRFSFAVNPMRSLWFGGEKKRDHNNTIVVGGGEEEEEEEEQLVEGENEPVRSEEQRGNWVLKILQIRSLWNEKQEKNNGVSVLEKDEKKNEEEEDNNQSSSCSCSDEDEGSEDEKMEFDRDSFSKLLRRVSLSDAKLYAQMSYLGKLAYAIPKIKPGFLFKYKGLRFVTSSVEKKAQSMNTEEEGNSGKEKPGNEEKMVDEQQQQKKNGYRISPAVAYHVAASAASYLQSRTRSILPFKRSNSNGLEESSGENSGSGTEEKGELSSSEVASFVVTSNSLTAVVSAKEEMKQAVAKDLNSVHSSPCGWFICDDDCSGTRFFVIQGSDSLASWQANLLFEPIQFEGLDVLVHRGIYEAAKGIYEQMLPEVREHLKTRGDSATFRFTGHSLGGSLSALINLMLLLRGEVPASALLPVITFGSPSIMCGGDQLLRRLGLPRNHIQSITMHRDIVPRAFSCRYPDHVVELLKAVNGNFRNHPCLKNQKFLYAPMGEILILQPDEKHSPHHHLLPLGAGLYVLSCALSDSIDPEQQLQNAQTVFLNSPHPLEILSDRSAYGSGGTIYRDHDMNFYLKSVRYVVSQELNHIRRSKRERRRLVWWPLVTPLVNHNYIIEGTEVASSNATEAYQRFSIVIRTGKQSLQRFSTFVTSRHMHLLVLLVVPAKLLIMGAFAVMHVG